MFIASWNVNGIRSVERKGDLQDFIQTYQPDVLFLQEIKGNPGQFSDFLNGNDHYQTWYHPAEKPGYAGTGVWVKKGIVIEKVVTGFEENLGYTDDEGRVMRIDLTIQDQSWSMLGVYFPNGGKSPEAWDDKLVFYDTFLQYVNELRDEGRKVIWGGDINCAHEEIDLARPESNRDSIGFLPEERDWVSRCIQEGWTDIFRKRYPDTVIYSWWHLLTKARARNVGWRIDSFFVDQTLLPLVQDIKYLNEQMGSDHCPVVIAFKE